MSTTSTYYVQFHSIQYVLSILVAATGHSSGKTLLVDIEQEESGARWTGEFASKYIEDITQKTGNFKRFSVFVNMLRKSLDSSKSNSVFVDLLTSADLTELKNRRSKGDLNGSTSSSASASSSSSSSHGKRYLILTYTAEFDKVHYPLPLTFEEHPSPATLQRTISRLRRELVNGGRQQSTAAGTGTGTSSASGSTSVDVVDLQRQLHVVRAENDAFRRNKGNAAAVEARIAFQKYRETSDMEISQLKKDCKSLASKLRDSRTKQDQVVHKYEQEKTSSTKSSSVAKELRALERKNTSLRQALQREKDANKRTQSTSQRLVMKLKKEHTTTKSALTRMRMELREVKKKAAARSVSRGRSTTPRSIGGQGRRRAGARDRSTSSTRSTRSTRSNGGMSSVNTSRTSSVNTSTNSRRSIRSARSARSTRSTKSTKSARSAGTSSNYGSGAQRRRNAGRSTSSTARRRGTPSPASSYGQSRGGSSTARSTARSRGRSTTRKNTSNSSGTSSTGRRRKATKRTARTKSRTNKNSVDSMGRRSKRHPSPFQYSSGGDSRSSSLESRTSEKGGTKRKPRTRISSRKSNNTKKLKKKTTHLQQHNFRNVSLFFHPLHLHQYQIYRTQLGIPIKCQQLLSCEIK